MGFREDRTEPSGFLNAGNFLASRLIIRFQGVSCAMELVGYYMM
jgi:hypothetical protein